MNDDERWTLAEKWKERPMMRLPVPGVCIGCGAPVVWKGRM